MKTTQLLHFAIIQPLVARKLRHHAGKSTGMQYPDLFSGQTTSLPFCQHIRQFIISDLKVGQNCFQRVPVSRECLAKRISLYPESSPRNNTFKST